jgi:valyl-tRNA synthetase
MLGDTAVMVHPGRRALQAHDRQDGEAAADRSRNPDHRRRYVDLEFGTGCVKVTPAHDFNDYAVGQRHGCR